MPRPIHAPATDAEVLALVGECAAGGQTLDIQGGGSKRGLRAHAPADAVLDLSAIAGITDYDPDELVLTARAGTRLVDIEAALAERHQMLAFEPFDHAVLLGTVAGSATLGGIIAANVSGSRRVSAGAARDHILGFSGVSGRGDALKGGGTVVKNVTGFDLAKLMAGSWGTLAALTSVTVRVLPRPRTENTVVYEGLSDEAANCLMTAALSSAAAVSCAAHLPSQLGVTALRIEGFGPSVEVRCRELTRVLSSHGTASVLDAGRSAALWQEVCTVRLLPVLQHLLWRVSVPPANGWQVGVRLGLRDARFLYDWGGALVWIAIPYRLADTDVAGVARSLGGHAMLVRAPQDLRPVSAAGGAGGALMRLRARVKAAFDPHGIFNPGLDLATES